MKIFYQNFQTPTLLCGKRNDIMQTARNYNISFSKLPGGGGGLLFQTIRKHKTSYLPRGHLEDSEADDPPHCHTLNSGYE